MIKYEDEKIKIKHTKTIELKGSSFAWGDYDSDGDLDLVFSGITKNSDNNIKPDGLGVVARFFLKLKEFFLRNNDPEFEGDIDIINKASENDDFFIKLICNNII
jgi:hypothetical protein